MQRPTLSLPSFSSLCTNLPSSCFLSISARQPQRRSPHTAIKQPSAYQILFSFLCFQCFPFLLLSVSILSRFPSSFFPLYVSLSLCFLFIFLSLFCFLSFLCYAFILIFLLLFLFPSYSVFIFRSSFCYSPFFNFILIFVSLCFSYFSHTPSVLAFSMFLFFPC